MSVAVLLAVLGSIVPEGTAIVAVLMSGLVAAGETVPVAENVADPPASRSTLALMSPVPPALPQLEPAVATQVQVTPVRSAGNGSLTVAVTELGPALEATMV